MSITIATWNVLAQAYVRADTHGRCDRRALGGVARRALIVERVAALVAGADGVDVLALQEAEEPLVQALARRLKPAHHVAFAQKSEGKPDGCALVVKTELVHAPLAALSYADGTGHVAQLMKVDGPTGPLVVANTHLVAFAQKSEGKP